MFLSAFNCLLNFRTALTARHASRIAWLLTSPGTGSSPRRQPGEDIPLDLQPRRFGYAVGGQDFDCPVVGELAAVGPEFQAWPAGPGLGRFLSSWLFFRYLRSPLALAEKTVRMASRSWVSSSRGLRSRWLRTRSSPPFCWRICSMSSVPNRRVCPGRQPQA